jgi:multiple sugar transport system permease protein
MSGGTALAPAEQANDGLLPAWRRSARPYLLVIPAVALTIGILYPFVQGAIYAFQNYKATRPNHAGRYSDAEVISSTSASSVCLASAPP